MALGVLRSNGRCGQDVAARIGQRGMKNVVVDFVFHIRRRCHRRTRFVRSYPKSLSALERWAPVVPSLRHLTVERGSVHGFWTARLAFEISLFTCLGSGVIGEPTGTA